MSLHFNGNQFDREYAPRRLGNWEIPRRFPARPHIRTGHTRIIANNRGHLLPGEPRPPHGGPWGHFISTWQMPKRITREIANELREPVSVRAKSAWAKNIHKPKPETVKSEDPEKHKPDTSKQVEGENVCSNEGQYKPKPSEDGSKKDLSYVPGDLTSPRYRHPSYYKLLRPPKEDTLEDIREKDMADIHKHRHSAESCREHRPRLPNPFACVYKNFEMAKKCHMENLEHHPLPDTVTDTMYRKLQMQGSRHPGIGLKDEPRATGVGWKGYASGPTQCTKMRVYRPKTSAPKKPKNIDDRPGSCGTFEMKWRFIKQKQVTPIELAICWDMRPENPADEPKRTPHIDGSNGSMAPAVFAMVQSPKQPQLEDSPKSPLSKCDGIHGCGTIKGSSLGSNQSCSGSGCNTSPGSAIFRPKTSSPVSLLASKNGSEDSDKRNYDRNNNLKQLKRHSSTNSLFVNAALTRKPSKDTANQTFDTLRDKDRKKFHQSSPNLSTISCDSNFCSKDCLQRAKKQIPCRPCAACDAKNYPVEKDRSKSEYKQAFKAGKLNTSLDGTISSGSGSGSGTRVSVKVPKQRDPYAKRNYDINSLHPPFSLWKGTSDKSYPEHWRLASVYQHSYKPVETRKRPLLASVYQ